MGCRDSNGNQSHRTTTRARMRRVNQSGNIRLHNSQDHSRWRPASNATGNGYRAGERAKILSAELAPATDAVAKALGLNERAAVVKRQRLYLDDLGVVSLSTSWLSGELWLRPFEPKAEYNLD